MEGRRGVRITFIAFGVGMPIMYVIVEACRVYSCLVAGVGNEKITAIRFREFAPRLADLNAIRGSWISAEKSGS